MIEIDWWPNFTIEETRSRPGYNNQPPTSRRCIISHLQVYILFAERIVERVAKVCSLDPWKNTGLTFPLPGGLWKRTLHVCPWNGQCGNSVPTESRIQFFVSFHRRGRSWSVFFVLFFLLWTAAHRATERMRVASRRRSRDARHPRSFPRLRVPPFPRHLRIWKRDRRSNHAVQAQEVLDFPGRE